jgi:Ring finger domain
MEEASKEFKCLICLVEFREEKSIFPLAGCEHIFHKECLKKMIEGEINAGNCPV